jgi:hypothetical protein
MVYVVEELRSREALSQETVFEFILRGLLGQVLLPAFPRDSQ